MPFLITLGLILLFALLFIPQWWVKWVMKKYSSDRNDFPGTGAELAQHLLEKAGISNVKVEETEQGDHYDPVDQAVRLSSGNFNGKSVTAIAIAAHETAHAIQHHHREKIFMTRLYLADIISKIEKIAYILFMSVPVILILLRSPLLVFIQIIAGILLLSSRLFMHLFTLPVEFDASFRKALPILMSGYLTNKDYRAARHVLLAAAFTYIAATCANFLNFLRFLRR